MRSDGPGLDLSWVAAMALAFLPVTGGLPGTMILCTDSGPSRVPRAPNDMPAGCHACLVSKRADEEETG